MPLLLMLRKAHQKVDSHADECAYERKLIRKLWKVAKQRPQTKAMSLLPKMLYALGRLADLLGKWHLSKNLALDATTAASTNLASESKQVTNQC